MTDDKQQKFTSTVRRGLNWVHAQAYSELTRNKGAVIKPASNAVLNTIVAVMKTNSQWHLCVEDHTDNIGGDSQNQDLAARRETAVRAALVERGIAEERLTTSGHCAASPRDTNATLAGRAHNRRVELTRL